MKTIIAEPCYTDNSISQKILIPVRSKLLSIFRSENGHGAESGDLEASKVSVKGKRNPSKNDYAKAIDQLAKFRTGIY